MNFLRNLFSKKEMIPEGPAPDIDANEAFWNWFVSNEAKFFQVLQSGKNIERNFLELVLSKLKRLRDGYWLLTGMKDDQTAELIITADGDLKNFVFVEELIAGAPVLPNWQFTAHKPAHHIEDVHIEMGEFAFNQENMHFVPLENPEYPDEIAIEIVHDDLTEKNKEQVRMGIYLFLDHFLGEEKFATSIDYLDIAGPEDVSGELIPVKKLKEYITWREKEFIEKYDSQFRDTSSDNYQGLKGMLDTGQPMVAIINADIIHWDAKPSHPWMLQIVIKFKGNDEGMPDQALMESMNDFEDAVLEQLKDTEGYINLGRETADSERHIFIACREFRKPAKVMDAYCQENSYRLNVAFDLFKDKYWKSMNRFRA